VQREQRDEELGQVSQRRLDDARRGGADPASELVRRAADELREHRNRGSGEEEGKHRFGVEVVGQPRAEHKRGRDTDPDQLPALHPRMIADSLLGVAKAVPS
jgi:hypothetical protein